MGWTSLHQKPHNVVKYLTEQWNPEFAEVLRAACVGFSTVYMAVRDKRTGLVFAAVYLTRYNRGDTYNFSYKDLDESSGPCECDCPESILQLLSPIEDFQRVYGREYTYAREWREACWANVRKKKQARALKDGVLISFASPISFGSYGTHTTFYVRKDARKMVLYAAERLTDGIYRQLFPVRIRGWKKKEFVVVTSANVCKA